jgi:hypothetical protein
VSVSSAEFNGLAIGTSVARPLIAMRGDIAHGIIDAAPQQSYPGWLAFKTLWIISPSYQGPIVVRAERLDHPGVMAFGSEPSPDVLVVPPGPTMNSFPDGYRTVPGQSWVYGAGCYGWQVDGLTFSSVLVVSVMKNS